MYRVDCNCYPLVQYRVCVYLPTYLVHPCVNGGGSLVRSGREGSGLRGARMGAGAEVLSVGLERNARSRV